MTFEEWKLIFNTSDTTVEVDWDSGHAYHSMNSESPDPDWCDDPDSAYDYQSEYMSEHGPELYCAPELINELCGPVVVSDECPDHYCKTLEDKIEYIEGFIELAESMKMNEWYHTDKLRGWVMIQRVNKIIKSGTPQE